MCRLRTHEAYADSRVIPADIRSPRLSTDDGGDCAEIVIPLVDAGTIHSGQTGIPFRERPPCFDKELLRFQEFRLSAKTLNEVRSMFFWSSSIAKPSTLISTQLLIRSDNESSL